MSGLVDPPLRLIDEQAQTLIKIAHGMVDGAWGALTDCRRAELYRVTMFYYFHTKDRSRRLNERGKQALDAYLENHHAAD